MEACVSSAIKAEIKQKWSSAPFGANDRFIPKMTIKDYINWNNKAEYSKLMRTMYIAKRGIMLRTLIRDITL